MAKKIFLITSSVKNHRNNFRYLDYGCINLSSVIKKESILFEHPWNNKKKYYKDTVKLNKIYLKILNKLSDLLNNYHKVNKNYRYWKILIGPWLHSFIFMHYEKNLLIKILSKYKKKINITVTSSKIENQIPDSFFTYFVNHVYSKSWNDYLFSQIISKEKLSKNFNIIKKKDNSKIVSETKPSTFLEQLIGFFFINLSKFFVIFLGKRPLIFFRTGLSFKNKIILIFKNLGLPFFINEKKRNISPDMLLRIKLAKLSNNKNKYEKEILRLAIINLPTDFLENFLYIGQVVSLSNKYLVPKVLFTSNGIYPSSFETRYVAECVSKGSKLIIAQHGGRYGNLKKNFALNHEIDISDYFLSWGKQINNKKIKNLGITKTFKSINRLNKNNKDILFLMVTKGRFSRSIDSEINIKELYNYYKNICPNFYLSLNKNLKKNLVYRSSKRNYWNEKSHLESTCRNSRIDFDRGKTDLFDAAINSRIVVCSYLSTTFLELLNGNIPVILFTPFSNKGYNSLTLKSFKILRKNKIFFNSHKDAANFLNNNWNKIDKWWFSNEVQKNRKIFLQNFSRENPNLINDIQILIKTCKKNKY